MRQTIRLLLVFALAGIAMAQESLNVRLVGRCPIVEGVSGVALGGDYAYVVGGGYGLRVVSVTDPAGPFVVGQCQVGGGGSGVAVNGGYAYVATADSGLQVISVADPASPSEVGRCGTPGRAFGVAVAGDHAYVVDDSSVLRVIDVADPAHPVDVGHCDIPSQPFAWGVAVSGEYAYVADLDSGLRVIHVADPAHPAEVGHFDTPSVASGVVVVGEHAYVACDACLAAISIADPAHPVEVGFINLVGPSQDVGVTGDIAYVASLVLRVVSIADPANPLEVGHYVDPLHGPYRVVAHDGYAYTGEGGSYARLGIYQYYTVGVEESHKPQATSYKLAATVVRSLPRGAVAFDAMGRRVVNPRPGVYFVRSEPSAVSRQPTAVTKVIISR